MEIPTEQPLSETPTQLTQLTQQTLEQMPTIQPEQQITTPLVSEQPPSEPKTDTIEAELRTFIAERNKSEPTAENAKEPQALQSELQRSQDTLVPKIEDVLRASDYEIVKEILIEGVDIVATRNWGPYKQIFVKYLPTCTLRDLRTIDNAIEKHHADLGMVITETISSELNQYTVGRKLELIYPSEFLNYTQT
jgi:hypothetical protein